VVGRPCGSLVFFAYVSTFALETETCVGGAAGSNKLVCSPPCCSICFKNFVS